jgi:hypothetical protein
MCTLTYIDKHKQTYTHVNIYACHLTISTNTCVYHACMYTQERTSLYLSKTKFSNQRVVMAANLPGSAGKNSGNKFSSKKRKLSEILHGGGK